MLSGFVHEDNTEKPSYYALQKLIHGDWETHETLITDEEGFVSFTGFKGDYTVKAAGGTAAFSLNDNQKDLVQLTK